MGSSLRFKSVLLALSLCLSTAGCGGLAFIPAGAPIGLVQSTSTSKAVGSSVIGTRHGKACAISILQVVTVGDASVSAAARDGGITQIGVVDNDDFNLFGWYSRHCSEVTGN